MPADYRRLRPIRALVPIRFQRDTGRAMLQENVDFVFDLFAGAVALDKDALLAALPDLIEQTCDPDWRWCPGYDH